MLVRFTVENCLSFRDRVELSMIASEEVHDHPEHVIRAGGQDGIPILKLAVIYGANASGKSNLVKAMLMARGLILNTTGAGQRIDRAPFKLDPACRDKPTRFEFEIKLGDRYFAYGFSVSSERVEEEWLFEVGRTVEDRIFERTGRRFVWGRLEFSNPDEKAFLDFTAKGTLPNRLFLTECRERNVRENVPGAEAIINILEWFEYGLIVALPDGLSQNIALRVHSDESFRQQLTRYLQCFDTGLAEIDVEPMVVPEAKFSENVRVYLETLNAIRTMAGHGLDVSPLHFVTRDDQGSVRLWKLVSRHGGPNGMERSAAFDMSEESDGTRRLMQLVPAMVALMTGDGVFVIDELDRSLHADVVHSYLANFLKYSARRSSQLIVTTHDTALLRQHFPRRDEVWFVEKGIDQSSRLIALEEYKNVDQSKDLQQDYLLGRFGGVPVIRDFSWLGEEHGETT
jgi:AAA15 family ATPase/GTPase